MLIRLLLAFTIVPLLELFVLLQLARVTSVLTTIMIVILTGVVGSYLALREGAAAWQRFSQALAQSRMPSREIQDGILIVFAAPLLLTPGLLTDALGFTLLIPAGRVLVRKFVLGKLFRGMTFEVHGVGGSPLDRHQRNDSKTIDAKAVHKQID